MAIQNLNNLYTPGNIAKPRKRSTLAASDERNSLKAEEIGSAVEDDVQNPQQLFDSLSEKIQGNTSDDLDTPKEMQEGSINGTSEKIEESTIEVEKNKASVIDEAKALLGESEENDLPQLDGMEEYFKRFEEKKKEPLQKEQEKSENNVPKITVPSSQIDPDTGKVIGTADDVLAMVERQYLAAGGQVQKNVQSNYVEPKARAKHDPKQKQTKKVDLQSVSKKIKNTAPSRPAPSKPSDNVSQEKTEANKNKPEIKTAAKVVEKKSRPERVTGKPLAEIKAAPKSTGQPLKSEEKGKNVSKVEKESQTNIVSRETSNVNSNDEKTPKKITERPSVDKKKSEKVVNELIISLMEDEDVSEIVITSFDNVQVKFWDSNLDKYSQKYPDYEHFKDDFVSYVANNKIGLKMDATFSRKSTEAGDEFTLFNKKGADGDKCISVRIKKSKKVRYFNFDKLVKEGIQTTEMANVEAEGIKGHSSFVVYGEDPIDNLTVLNALATKIPTRDVGAFISYGQDLDYKNRNLEVFSFEPSQIDEQDGLLEALADTGTKWEVFGEIKQENLEHISNFLKKDSGVSTMVCLQTSDLESLPSRLGLSTTETRKFVNELKSEDTDCVFVKVGKDETGRLMIDSVQKTI